jgi:hypothetical protein
MISGNNPFSEVIRRQGDRTANAGSPQGVPLRLTRRQASQHARDQSVAIFGMTSVENSCSDRNAS